MKRSNAWYALLIFPFFGAVFPGTYNRLEPALFGIPFFYWYQMALVVLTSLVLGALAYVHRERSDV